MKNCVQNEFSPWCLSEKFVLVVMPNQRTRQRRKNRGEPCHTTVVLDGTKARISNIQSFYDVSSKCIYVSNCSNKWLMATVMSIFCTCKTFCCTRSTCLAAIGAEQLSATEVLIQFSSIKKAREAFKTYFDRPRAERCCWYSEESSKELQRNVKFYSIHYDLYTCFIDENNMTRKMSYAEHVNKHRFEEGKVINLGSV